MSEENAAGRERRGRRRYFRPKKQKDSAPYGGKPAQDTSENPLAVKPVLGRARKARRRARSRQRYAEESSGIVAAEPDYDYVAPKAVFVYSYAVHPELRDAYEFRPDHFSRVGRKLEDYTIDLSKLFQEGEAGPDGTPVMTELVLTKPEFNWATWEEEE